MKLKVVEPYDFALSLESVRSFGPASSEQTSSLRLAARVEGTPALIEVSGSPEGKLTASSSPEVSTSRVRSIAEWVLFAELDLAPFYRLTAKDAKLASLIKKLHGLKPMRPASLFEMAVIAITEQQISLAAAYQIRSRLVERFGVAVEDLRVFPEAGVLAAASPEELRAVGLSRQKADYILGLARKAADHSLDLDSLKKMGDDEARETIMSWRGFGAWSADYILVRGLARPDCVPADDIGIRDVIGSYLGDGRRVTRDEAAAKLEAFRPYRGLLAFYLLADHRMQLAEKRTTI